MPAPMVVATLPMKAAATRSVRPRSFDPNGPATLSLADAAASCDTTAFDSVAYAELLEEAMRLARSFGCEVRRRCLGGLNGGGYRWVRGRMRIVLDVEASHHDRLHMLADALRGEPRLGWVEMSDELAAFMQPRRAA